MLLFVVNAFGPRQKHCYDELDRDSLQVVFACEDGKVHAFIS